MKRFVFELFLEKEFKNVPYGEFLTLPESDYLDNYISFFGFPHYPYNYENYPRDLDEFEKSISGWLEKDKNIALSSIKENKKMHNPYTKWTEIPFIYLDVYANGFSYMDNKAFLFYTPAVIQYISRNMINNSNNISFVYWYYRIQSEYYKGTIDNLFEHFTKYQLCLVHDFLVLYYEHEDYHDEIKEINYKIGNLILNQA